MKLVLIALLSSIAGTAASVCMLFVSYATFYDQPVSGEDLMGIAVFSFAPALLMCGLFYTPGLLWLRRRRGRCEPAMLFALTSGLVLNVPAFAILIYNQLAGGFFGGGEAWFFVLALIVTGLMYGCGFVWHCRKRTAS